MRTSQSRVAATQSKPFPMIEIEKRLRCQLESVEAESRVLRGDWEPVFDSLRMVAVVIGLEDLFDFELSPEKLVRKGGYKSVEDGITDISAQLKELWRERDKIGEMP